VYDGLAGGRIVDGLHIADLVGDRDGIATGDILLNDEVEASIFADQTAGDGVGEADGCAEGNCGCTAEAFDEDLSIFYGLSLTADGAGAVFEDVDAGRSQDGGQPTDLLGCFSVGEEALAVIAVPELDVAFVDAGRSLCLTEGQSGMLAIGLLDRSYDQVDSLVGF